MTTMELTRCATAAEFFQRAETYLLQQEVHNCLPFGITIQLREHPERIRLPPYLAVVENKGVVVAAAVMTPPMRLVLAATESRDALQAIAADLGSYYMPAPGVTGPLPASRWFAELWHSMTGDVVKPGMAERIYKVTDVRRPRAVPGSPRRASFSDRDLLIEWFTAFELESFGTLQADIAERVEGYLELSTRGLLLWQDRRVVSMAGYGGLTPHGARIGPVFTPPNLRGHGYGSAVVARLSQDLLDGGRQFCCLYTDQTNATSNHIYQAIGYAPVCDVAEFKFTPADS
jgi:predicted GNAT family acetyltransferase